MHTHKNIINLEKYYLIEISPAHVPKWLEAINFWQTTFYSESLFLFPLKLRQCSSAAVGEKMKLDYIKQEMYYIKQEMYFLSQKYNL